MADFKTLDYAYGGAPYVESGPDDGTSLDYAFGGMPFVPEDVEGAVIIVNRRPQLFIGA